MSIEIHQLQNSVGRASSTGAVAAPSSANEPEVHFPDAVAQRGDGPGRGACPFLPRFLLHHIIFDHCLVDGLEPNKPRACREICCAERTASNCGELRAQSGQSYPSKKLPPTLGALCASISVPETAPRRAGPGGHTLAERHGIGAQAGSTALAGSGRSTMLGLLPECAQASAPTSACCTVSATVPSARARSHSQSVSASIVLPWKSPHRVRLALSQRSREKRKYHLHSSRCHLLTAERQPMDPVSIVQNTRSLSTLALVSLYTVRIFCSPAAFWHMEVDTQERSRRARTLLVQGALLAPSMADLIDAIAELPRPQRGGAHTLAGAGGPAFANAAFPETGQMAPPPRW